MEVNRGTLSHSSLNHNEPYSYSKSVKTTRYLQTTSCDKIHSHCPKIMLECSSSAVESRA